MKRYYWIFIILGLLVSGCFSGSSLLFMESDSHNIPNLIVNHSFEHPAKDNPDSPLGWYIISTSTDMNEPVVLDSIQYVSGHRSLRINKSPRNLYIVSDAFKINYTGGYYIKGSVRAEHQMRKATRIYFWTYDSAGNKRNSFRKSIKAKQDWRKAEISAGFLKNSASFARIAIFVPKDATNTIWLDDFGCYLVHRFGKE